MRGLFPALKQAVTSSQNYIDSDLWQLRLISAHDGKYSYHCQSINPRQLDLSAKIFPRDAQEGAWHEYAAMRTLWYHNIRKISPEPLLLVEQKPDFQHDVIISEWVHGEAFPRHKFNKLLWTTVLHTLAEVHKITPEFSSVQVPSAIHSVANPNDLLVRLLNAIEHLPQPNSSAPVLNYFRLIGRLMNHAENNLARQWSNPVPIRLTHGDCTIENFVYEDGTVRFVDWELAGWSDPAMDIATLISHPSALHLTEDECEWLINQYTDIIGQRSLPHRIHVYSELLDAIWFVEYVSYLLSDNPYLEAIDQVLETVGHYASRIEHRYKWNYS